MKKTVIKVKFSVVCPTYNSEKFIINTLETLLAQKEKPYEIIMVDDGSTDNTINILNEYQKKFYKININFIIIKNKHNGPGHARNTGIQKSNGNWIAFLDSDDSWTKDKLLRVKDEILSNPDANFILHWEKLIGQELLHILRHGQEFKKDKNLCKQLFKNNFISTSASTCKKSLLINNQFDEKLKVSQDYELWLRLSPYMNISIIRKVLGNYYVREGSITSKPYIIRLFYLLKILFRHRDKSNVIYLIVRLVRAFITTQWIKI